MRGSKRGDGQPLIAPSEPATPTPGSPAQILADNVVLTAGQIARLLDYTPDVTRALMRADRIRVVDRDQPVTRWRVSVNDFRNYLDTGGTP
jgi:hypothetical protein